MQHFDDQKAVTTREFKEFVKEIVNRLGAEALLTPAEIIRDFISILNILQQNPETSFSELIHGFSFPLHLKTRCGWKRRSCWVYQNVSEIPYNDKRQGTLTARACKWQRRLVGRITTRPNWAISHQLRIIQTTNRLAI